MLHLNIRLSLNRLDTVLKVSGREQTQLFVTVRTCWLELREYHESQRYLISTGVMFSKS